MLVMMIYIDVNDLDHTQFIIIAHIRKEVIMDTSELF